MSSTATWPPIESFLIRMTWLVTTVPSASSNFCSRMTLASSLPGEVVRDVRDGGAGVQGQADGNGVVHHPAQLDGAALVLDRHFQVFGPAFAFGLLPGSRSSWLLLPGLLPVELLDALLREDAGAEGGRPGAVRKADGGPEVDLVVLFVVVEVHPAVVTPLVGDLGVRLDAGLLVPGLADVGDRHGPVLRLPFAETVGERVGAGVVGRGDAAVFRGVDRALRGPERVLRDEFLPLDDVGDRAVVVD